MDGISVILTTYNGASRGYLQAAIESVLAQGYAKYELIIVDDGSKDETATICKKYLTDPRIHYYYQENRGVGNARNQGIALSKYDYICFLDDDDLYLPDKLEKQIMFFSTHSDPKIGMVYTALRKIDGNGNFLGIERSSSWGNIYESLFAGNCVTAPSSVMIHKRVFDRVGLFNEYFSSCEDYEMWLRIAKHFHIYSDREPLVSYRLHPHQKSYHLGGMQRCQLYALFLALREAPKEIRDKKFRFYHQFHICCAAQYLVSNNFASFRRHYRIAKIYAPGSILWQVRYFLSFFPALFLLIRKVKHVLYRLPIFAD